MKIAYLILAHKYPQLVARSVNRLAHPDCHFFIHWDKKSNLADLQQYLPECKSARVNYVLPRCSVYWAGYSMVDATLSGLAQIASCENEFDYCVLLSGQDYPVKTVDYIMDFFEKNNGKQYIKCEPIDNRKRRWRTEHYWFRDFTGWARVRFPGHLGQYIEYYTDKISKVLPEKTRLREIDLYTGWQWWALSIPCIKQMLDYLPATPQFTRFFKTVAAPDEIFFQTLIMTTTFKNSIAGRDVHYVNWKDNIDHPEVLTEESLGDLLNSDKLFCRKIEMEKSAGLLNAIDSRILGL